MTTALEKTIKRALELDGKSYVVAVSPTGLKITLKGHRNGVEYSWKTLVTGSSAADSSGGEPAGSAAPSGNG
jgi:hypothetical protein